MDKSNGGEGVEVSTSSSSPAIGSAVVVGSIPNEGVVFRDVSFAYPSRPDALILSRFSLEVGPRALTVVAGRSGAGKSTLMAVLAGLYTALEGEVFVNGENLTSANRETIRSKVRDRGVNSICSGVREGGTFRCFAVDGVVCG